MNPSVNRDPVLKPDIITVPPSALEVCEGPVNKPESGKVFDVITAWQEDRNLLRECQDKNEHKIKVINQLISDDLTVTD
jgi:hypothetical protein